MREYLLCLRAIFQTFQDREQPSYFEGEHYKFTMLPPVFSPPPIEHPKIPIEIAAVNPYMSRLAGELADGVFAHLVCTAKYIREKMIPRVEKGAREAGRKASELEIIGAPIIVTARDAAEMEKEKHLLKQRVAFYASTRTYHSVFEVHGWNDLGMRLHGMSLENRWDEMVTLIPDEMAEAFGTIAPVEELGERLKETWGGVLTTMSLPTDFPLDTREDERRAREILEILHAAPDRPVAV